MNLPYLVRLLCLSLACFFLIHFALGTSVSLLSSAVLKFANRFKPSAAAGLVLMARLFPCAAATLLVAGICVPSYLWLEPEATVESVGLVCFSAALLSVAGLTISIRRGSHAVALSMLYRRHCQQVGCETKLPGETTPVLVMEGSSGLLALAGIFRSKLVISREVLHQLSADQLAAALRHECAHRSARDNLKRLLLLLAPDVLPFPLRCLGGFEALEHNWARFAEWAADDRAVEGDPHGSVSLAGALVRVARLVSTVPASPLMTSLVANGSDLEARVERLLELAPVGEKPVRWKAWWTVSSTLVVAILVTVSAGDSIWQATYELLEKLIR